MSGSETDRVHLLARAFDGAWAQYYRPRRLTLPPEVARTALAKHLVEMANTGVDKEAALVEAGLEHLNGLTPRKT